MRSRECAPIKHHYDECAERVTKQIEEHGKASEDCVEECMFLLGWHPLKECIANLRLLVFHVMHCANQCAAPKLFRELK